MGLRQSVCACALVLVVSACAHAPLPSSLTAMVQLQMRQRAAMFPGSVYLPGSSHQAHFRTLKAWTESKNVIVTLADLSRRELRGSIQPGYGGPVILLEQDLEPNEHLHILLHELGHLFGPKPALEADREVVAELVAVLTCEQLGLDAWGQTALYLSRWAVDLDQQMRTAQIHGPAIDALVARLTLAATPKG